VDPGPGRARRPGRCHRTALRRTAERRPGAGAQPVPVRGGQRRHPDHRSAARRAAGPGLRRAPRAGPRRAGGLGGSPGPAAGRDPAVR
jgi:hypothetical protein